MHGIIFVELKKYVVARLGGQAWNQLLAAAGMEGKIFLPSTTYPDEELGRLVATAAKITGKPASAIVEDFGVFIAPDLLNLYKARIDPAWRTLDLIANTEALIHEAVRLKMPGAKPPQLVAVREGPDRLKIIYGSERKLCSLVRGLSQGIADHYKESIEIEEPACMHRGDPKCEIRLRRPQIPIPLGQPRGRAA